MKTLIIDRVEGGFVICEDENKDMFGIEIAEMPKEAKEGDVIDISDEGVITVNQKKTKERKERMGKKMGKLFK